MQSEANLQNHKLSGLMIANKLHCSQLPKMMQLHIYQICFSIVTNSSIGVGMRFGPIGDSLKLPKQIINFLSSEKCKHYLESVQKILTEGKSLEYFVLHSGLNNTTPYQH